MRIYVSSGFTAQARLRPMADRLRSFGHDITSTWLYEAAKPATLNTDEWYLALADKDLAEIFAADCIILDLDDDSATGGCHVEWGAACFPGSLRRRYLVGGYGEKPKHGVFLAKAHRRFKDWDDLFAYFQVNHAR